MAVGEFARKVIASVRSNVADLVVNVIGAGGLCSITYGVHLYSKPLGYVVGGLFMLGAAWLLSKVWERK